MQTTPGSEKGRHAANVTTPMQTDVEFRASVPVLQQPLEQRIKPMSERQRRAVDALLMLGCVPTNQMPRIAGCNNAPALVGKLRDKYGLAIPCDVAEVTDRDGHAVQAGAYRLTDADRTKLADVLLVLARGRA